MIGEWLLDYGYAPPTVEPTPCGRSSRVVVLLVMINVAANKAVPGYYLFWRSAGPSSSWPWACLDGCTWADLGLAPCTWPRGLIWGGIAVLPGVRGLRRGDHLETDPTGLPRSEHRRTLVAPAVLAVDGRVAVRHRPSRGGRVPRCPVGHARAATAWSGPPWSSLLFGLWHILPSLDLHLRNERLGQVGGGGHRARITAIVGSVVATGIGGVVFCLLRIGSGSLFAPMGLHWATNGWGYLFARR